MKKPSALKVKFAVRPRQSLDLLSRIAARIETAIQTESWRTKYFRRLLEIYVKILNRSIQKRQHVPDMLSTLEIVEHPESSTGRVDCLKPSAPRSRSKI